MDDSSGASVTNPVSRPPHHISDIDKWGGHADRNYYVFIALTFLFGFFGLDHMYLRSNETAFKKLLLNVFGLGIWYIWDIIQVLKDGKVVRKEGLNSPFDWIRGIGRGMFQDGPGAATKPAYAAPKSYFIYTLLAIGLGVFGADKFYLGNTWQGVAKLFSVFNIFLFLFGIMWVLWDAVHAYFMTKSLLKDGIAPPVPFSWFFNPISPDIFKVQEVKETPKDAVSGGLLSYLPIPALPLRELYRELVVPILQPTVGAAIQNVTKVASVGTKVAALGTAALAGGPAFVGNIVNQMNNQADQAAQQVLETSPLGTTVDAVKAVANAAAAATTTAAAAQTGGGVATPTSSGPGPILGGALTALILAGGLKGFYDFFSKQLSV